MYADVVISRCKNHLETQADVASVFAHMLAEMDSTPQEKIDAAIQAVKTRWPSKTGFLTVKKMAWRIYETRQRAQHRLQSDKSGPGDKPENLPSK